MSTVERQTLLPKDWLVQYQPRWWQWRLKKKTLWVKHPSALHAYIGYSVGISTATKSEAIKCDHKFEWEGEQCFWADAHLDGKSVAHCPDCGVKL